MDMAKEGLFNILANQIQFNEISVLDLYGGTGSIALEFISRGCPLVTYVDKSHICVSFVNDINHLLSLQKEFKIIKSDVLLFLERNTDKYDLIFADPPYDYKFIDKIIDKIFNKKLLNTNGQFILEHDKHHNFTEHPFYLNSRKYGTNIFSWFGY